MYIQWYCFKPEVLKHFLLNFISILTSAYQKKIILNEFKVALPLLYFLIITLDSQQKKFGNFWHKSLIVFN